MGVFVGMSRVNAVTSRGWQHIYRFYAFHLTAQMAFLGAVWILYLTHRGYSLAEVGLAEAAFHLAPILLEIPSGSFADLVGRRWSLVVSSLLVVAGNVFLWNAGNLAVVMIAMFLTGASFSFRSGADQAFLYDALSAEQRSRYGRVFGRLLSAGYLIGGLSTWIGAMLSEQSYTIPLALSSIAAACGIVLAFGLEEPSRERTHAGRPGIRGHIHDVRALLRTRPAVAMMLIVAALFWTTLTIGDLYAQAAFSDRGLSNGQIGLLLGSVSVAIAAGTTVGGQLTGSFSRQWPVFTILTGLGVILIGLETVVLAIVAFVAAQFASGIIETRISAWYNAQLPSGQRATVLSIESWLFSCLMIVLFPLAGWFAGAAGWSALYLVCGCVGAATSIAALVIRKHPETAPEGLAEASPST
jgi:MFS family permease